MAREVAVWSPGDTRPCVIPFKRVLSTPPPWSRMPLAAGSCHEAQSPPCRPPVTSRTLRPRTDPGGVAERLRASPASAIIQSETTAIHDQEGTDERSSAHDVVGVVHASFTGAAILGPVGWSIEKLPPRITAMASFRAEWNPTVRWIHMSAVRPSIRPGQTRRRYMPPGLRVEAAGRRGSTRPG